MVEARTSCTIPYIICHTEDSDCWDYLHKIFYKQSNKRFAEHIHTIAQGVVSTLFAMRSNQFSALRRLAIHHHFNMTVFIVALSIVMLLVSPSSSEVDKCTSSLPSSEIEVLQSKTELKEKVIDACLKISKENDDLKTLADALRKELEDFFVALSTAECLADFKVLERPSIHEENSKWTPFRLFLFQFLFGCVGGISTLILGYYYLYPQPPLCYVDYLELCPGADDTRYGDRDNRAQDHGDHRM